MTILAIDTSEQACSVALANGDTVIDSVSEIIGRGHAERLLPLIEERLTNAGLGYPDLTRIAVTTGPGTFTGLRIGLAVARGLALQADIPCIGLTGLAVLAAQARANAGTSIHAMITGRGGQAFYQRFQASADRCMPEPVTEAVGLDAEDIAAEVTKASGIAIGSGVDLLLEKGLLDRSQDSRIEFSDARFIDPAKLAFLAQGREPEAYPPEPTYFRAADAKKATPILPVHQSGG